MHHQAVDRAVAGQRAAVNLQGLDCEAVPRGSNVVRPGAFDTTRRIWARLRKLPNAPKSLLRGGPVRFHQGTCERGGRLRVLRATADPDLLDVELFLDEETLLAPGDRFILRRPAPVDTIAGGYVVDIHPGRPREADAMWFEIDPGDLAGLLRLQLARVRGAGLDLGEAARSLGVPAAFLEQRLADAGAPAHVREGRRIVDAACWTAIGEEALSAIGAHHRAYPLAGGIDREALRATSAPSMPQDLWRRRLDDLAAAGTVRLEGQTVALPEHSVTLTASQERIASTLDTRFREAGLEPPDLAAVLDEIGGAETRDVVDVLVARGSLRRIHDGRLFHADALTALRARLREYGRQSPTIDVAAFKDLAGVTRKNAIPLLEQLDQERFTRRVGNLREILVRAEEETAPE